MYPSKKLSPKHYGPFSVDHIISPVVYCLCLPKTWKIHNVFHASYLLPVSETLEHGENFPRPPPELIEGEKEWEVEQILGIHKFGHNKTTQYRVRWKGYLAADNTWEPEENIHTPELIEQYHKTANIKTLCLRQTIMMSTPNSPVLLAKQGPPSPPSSPDHYSFDQDRDVDQLTDQVDTLQLDDTLGTCLGESGPQTPQIYSDRTDHSLQSFASLLSDMITTTTNPD
jgi:Chromo (CHRromatin Organisation MOdifier) domain